ncbi:DUF402 domain-containing protein [Paenibacillus guangzhouensis]|uniref:DUF402 domain-containing protein n=1 Tax=Paenibacillus guangzhouensis TaxID=1473112 RepID=UPI00187B3F64|nr:DUF402 domain-containing protein [Paenibacillus guangzhouensis]
MKIKRKIADLSDWNRKLRVTYRQILVKEDDYQGYVTRVQFDDVEEPIWYQPDTEIERYRLVDDQYVWLQYFPNHANYAVTTVIDPNGVLVHHYVDIHAGNGVSSEGVPYFDDLFLDLVILPSGVHIVLDAEELEEALERAVITSEQYELAWRTLHTLQQGIETSGTAWYDRWRRDAAQLSGMMSAR